MPALVVTEIHAIDLMFVEGIAEIPRTVDLAHINVHEVVSLLTYPGVYTALAVVAGGRLEEEHGAFVQGEGT